MFNSAGEKAWVSPCSGLKRLLIVRLLIVNSLTVMFDMVVISSIPELGLLARKLRCTEGDTWQPMSTSSTSLSKGSSLRASANLCSLGFQGSPCAPGKQTRQDMAQLWLIVTTCQDMAQLRLVTSNVSRPGLHEADDEQVRTWLKCGWWRGTCLIIPQMRLVMRKKSGHGSIEAGDQNAAW